MEFLSGKKTYIVAFLMIVLGIVNMATGDASGWAMVADNAMVLLEGLGFATVRAGVAKLA